MKPWITYFVIFIFITPFVIASTCTTSSVDLIDDSGTISDNNNDVDTDNSDTLNNQKDSPVMLVLSDVGLLQIEYLKNFVQWTEKIDSINPLNMNQLSVFQVNKSDKFSTLGIQKQGKSEQRFILVRDDNTILPQIFKKAFDIDTNKQYKEDVGTDISTISQSQRIDNLIPAAKDDLRRWKFFEYRGFTYFALETAQSIDPSKKKYTHIFAVETIAVENPPPLDGDVNTLKVKLLDPEFKLPDDISKLSTSNFVDTSRIAEKYELASSLTHPIQIIHGMYTGNPNDSSFASIFALQAPDNNADNYGQIHITHLYKNETMSFGYSIFAMDASPPMECIVAFRNPEMMTTNTQITSNPDNPATHHIQGFDITYQQSYKLGQVKAITKDNKKIDARLFAVKIPQTDKYHLFASAIHQKQYRKIFLPNTNFQQEGYSFQQINNMVSKRLELISFTEATEIK